MNDIIFGDYKVVIREDLPGMSNNVYLMKHEANRLIFIRGDASVVTVSDGERINEEEVVFAKLSNDQLQAFAEALAAKGIKTNKDSIAEGKLAATEKHLEDMRTIALYNFIKKST